MKVKEFIEGLNIMAPYLKDDYSLRCDHDEFWIGSETEFKPMPALDLAKLDKLGWEWDDDADGYHANV